MVALKDGTVLDQAKMFIKDETGSVFVKKTGDKHTVLYCSNTAIKTSTTEQIELNLTPMPVEKTVKKAEKTRQERLIQLLRLSNQIDEFAMRLFLSLSKTVPCKWYFESPVQSANVHIKISPTAIVVFDEIVIPPPYTSDNLVSIESAGTPESTLDWIGQMIDRERKKLLHLN